MEACKNRSLKNLKSPVVNYVVREDGSISTVKLVKSSGLLCWDRAILATVKTWKYPKAPGCGERKATLSIDIDVSKLQSK
jgi:TonB family protein